MIDATATGTRGTGKVARINVCEVVGLFDSTTRLDLAVEQLHAAGIHPAAMSVLGVADSARLAGPPNH